MVNHGLNDDLPKFNSVTPASSLDRACEPQPRSQEYTPYFLCSRESKSFQHLSCELHWHIIVLYATRHRKVALHVQVNLKQNQICLAHLGCQSDRAAGLD
jgi:hypothetical protein